MSSQELAAMLFTIQNQGLESSELGPLWKLETFESELLSPNSELYLWPSSVHPSGYVLYRQTFEEAWIMQIAVNVKGQGLGSQLMQAFVEDLQKKHPETEKVGLEVGSRNLAAKNMYKKVGFEQVGLRKSYYPSGEDALVLRKCLQ